MDRAKGVSQMDIIFKGRRTGLQERFRRHATTKLGKIGKLDHKAIRIDVEVSQERNPRQSDRRERVELTIRSRGPVIRAEAAADDRFVAFDRAVTKLEARLRRACDRRKNRHGGVSEPDVSHFPDQVDGRFADGLPLATGEALLAGEARTADDAWPDDAWPANGAPLADGAPHANGAGGTPDGHPRPADVPADGHGRERRSGDFVPIAMEGDGPLVVREKFHAAAPMTIDRALLEMELVGHDFFLFRDQERSLPSVVYRRRGYDYGVIRLVEEAARDNADAADRGAAGQRESGVGRSRAAR